MSLRNNYLLLFTDKTFTIFDDKSGLVHTFPFSRVAAVTEGWLESDHLKGFSPTADAFIWIESANSRDPLRIRACEAQMFKSAWERTLCGEPAIRREVCPGVPTSAYDQSKSSSEQ